MSEIEKQISVLHELQCKCVENGFYGDIELAEKALREKQEQGAGCKYCENVPSRYKGITAEAFEQIAADDEHVVEIDTHFCPNCGRKIGESDES